MTNAPYPELVRSGYKFRVQESHETPCVSFEPAQMQVSFDDRDQSERRHEMAHARWSPPCHYADRNIDERIFIVLEEARVNIGSERIGLPVEKLRPERLEELEHLEMHDQGNVERGASPDEFVDILWAIATLGVVNHENPARSADAALIRGVVERHLRATPTEQVDMIALARRVVDMLPLRCKAMAHQGWQVVRYTVSDRRSPIGQRPTRTFEDWEGEAKPMAGDDQWGTMRMVEPDLPVVVAIPPVLRASRRRTAQEGSIITNMSRWTIDGSIFRTKRKRVTGGTVLLDVSGSMGIHIDNVQDMVDAEPGDTIVACYSGDSALVPGPVPGTVHRSGGTGHLTILARGGRRVAKVPEFPGENVVDGPALQWLARQPTPRMWVSDGMVTGADCRHSPELFEHARSICARAGIVRVHNWQETISVLKGKKI